MEVTDESTARYSLNCVQLRASDGRIAATDSSQLLLQHGFNFRWVGEVLVPQSSIFKQREFWSAATIRLGETADSVVFDTAPWTIWLTTNKDGRFPHVEDIIPAADTATTCMVTKERDGRSRLALELLTLASVLALECIVLSEAAIATDSSRS